MASVTANLHILPQPLHRASGRGLNRAKLLLKPHNSKKNVNTHTQTAVLHQKSLPLSATVICFIFIKNKKQIKIANPTLGTILEPISLNKENCLDMMDLTYVDSK